MFSLFLGDPYKSVGLTKYQLNASIRKAQGSSESVLVVKE
jgi:hypothetical protein